MILRCVVFDIGDTLVDMQREKTAQLAANILKKAGFPIDLLVAAKTYTKVGKRFMKKYYGSVKVHYPRYRFAMVLKELGLETTQNNLVTLESKFRASHIKTTLYPGAKQIVAYCRRKGLKTAVISNGSTEYIRSILKKQGLTHYFDYILISEEIGYEKSSLIPFKMILKKTRFKPEECLMVGNRIDEDMRASEAGFRTCLVEYFKFPVGGPPGKAEFKVKDIRDVRPIIDKLMVK